MKEKKDLKRLEELKKKILYHNKLYYQFNSPIISDIEYDKLFSELIKLEIKLTKKNISIQQNSPTQLIGFKPSKKFNLIKYLNPMLSLSNAFCKKEVIEFDKRIKKELNFKKAEIQYVIEPKIDGVAVNLIYKNSLLKAGCTRGNGFIGEDILKNLKMINDIPLKLINNNHSFSLPNNIEIRGEVYIEKKDFQQLNLLRKQEKITLFANPRNAAAGSIRKKDSNLIKERKLKIYFYAMGNKYLKIKIKNQWTFLKTIKNYGFRVNKHIKLVSGINACIKYFDSILEQRSKLPYEIDGIVIKVNSFYLQNILGSNLRSPRWALAYKFPANQIKTILKKIIFSVGRTGIITPIADLLPVNLSGVRISKANLYNISEIQKKDIREKDIVLIERAGDVIPKIIDVIKSARSQYTKIFEFPQLCPSCNSTLIKHKNNDTITLHCINITCPDQLKGKINYFVSRNGMNIQGLGGKIVSSLVEKKLIKDQADLYFLNQNLLIKEISRISIKLSKKIINSINNSKLISLEKFIYALGIRNIGSYASKLISKKFESIDQLIEASQEEKLLKINGIGKITANSIKKFFFDPKNIKLLEKFKKAKINIINNEFYLDKKKFFNKNYSKFQNKIVAVTGKLKTLKRTEVKDIIELLGGKFTKNLNKNTDFLIIGNKFGSKLNKAIQFNIKIITEKEFNSLIKKF